VLTKGDGGGGGAVGPGAAISRALLSMSAFLVFSLVILVCLDWFGFVCLFICLFICWFVCLFVCLFVWGLIRLEFIFVLTWDRLVC